MSADGEKKFLTQKAGGARFSALESRQLEGVEVSGFRPQGFWSGDCGVSNLGGFGALKDVWIAGFGVFFWRFQGVAPTQSSPQNADLPGGSLPWLEGVVGFLAFRIGFRSFRAGHRRRFRNQPRFRLPGFHDHAPATHN